MIKTYVIPVLSGLLLIILSGTWAYREGIVFRNQVNTIIDKEAAVVTESIKSIIQTQMRDGRVDKVRLNFILSNIVYGTSLKFVCLKKNDSNLFEIGEAPDDVRIKTADGYMIKDSNYYYWKTFKFVKPPPPPPEIMKMMHLMEAELPPPPFADHPDKFFDFRESFQTIIIGLNVSGFQQQVEDEKDKLSIIFAISVISVIILVFAWIHFIKSNFLKFELQKITDRNEKLEELSLTSAGLAHEVKNPLGIIRGFAQRISQNPDDARSIQDLSEHIIDECDITTERISDFINYAKHRPINKQVLPSRETIGGIINMLMFEIEDKKIRFEDEIDDVRLLADREFVQQIIVNVVMNSIQACKAGDRIVLRLKIKQNYALLTISDTGPGIDPGIMRQIYKPYVSGRRDGHGIGLAIVKKLVEEHGWKINMKSKPGHGTETEISKIQLVV